MYKYNTFTINGIDYENIYGLTYIVGEDGKDIDAISPNAKGVGEMIRQYLKQLYPEAYKVSKIKVHKNGKIYIYFNNLPDAKFKKLSKILTEEFGGGIPNPKSNVYYPTFSKKDEYTPDGRLISYSEYIYIFNKVNANSGQTGDESNDIPNKKKSGIMGPKRKKRVNPGDAPKEEKFNFSLPYAGNWNDTINYKNISGEKDGTVITIDTKGSIEMIKQYTLQTVQPIQDVDDMYFNVDSIGYVTMYVTELPSNIFLGYMKEIQSIFQRTEFDSTGRMIVTKKPEVSIEGNPIEYGLIRLRILNGIPDSIKLKMMQKSKNKVNDELIRACSGWRIVKRTVKFRNNDLIAYVVEKDKDTKPNTEDWIDIKAGFLLEGFKWSKFGFTKWKRELDDDAIERICSILEKYYDGDSGTSNPIPTLATPSTAATPNTTLSTYNKSELEQAAKAYEILASLGNAEAKKKLENIKNILNSMP